MPDARGDRTTATEPANADGNDAIVDGAGEDLVTTGTGPRPTTDPSGDTIPSSLRPRRVRFRRWLRRGAIVLAVLLLAVGADGFRLWHGVTRESLVLPGAGAGATNYLLIGSDSRSFVDGSADAASFGTDATVPGQRADMILLLHVPAEGRPTLLSIPRDLVVDMPGRGSHRLTLSLTISPQMLVDTVCHAFGLGIDHLVIVNFDGFRNLVDVVGGVDIDVPTPMRDTMTGLDVENAGPHHFNGDEALALVRSRHALVPDGNGSWHPAADGAGSRVEHGQALMKALGPPLHAMSGSIVGLHRLAGALAGTVTVDAGAGPMDARNLGNALQAADSQGTPVALPIALQDGPIPTAHLDRGATEILRSVGAGSNERCASVPFVPAKTDD